MGSNVSEVELVVGGGGIAFPRARQLKRQLGDISKRHLRAEKERETKLIATISLGKQ